MKSSFGSTLALAVIVGATLAGHAYASVLYRVPGHNAPLNAQNLNAYFSLQFNPDIGGLPPPPDFSSYGPNTSTTVPHVTVVSPPSNTRSGGGGFPLATDFYTFSVQAGGGHTTIDLDYTGFAYLGRPWTPNDCPAYFADCGSGGGDYFLVLRRLDGTLVDANDDHNPFSGATGSFYMDPFLDLDLAAGVYVLAVSMFSGLFPWSSYALHVSVTGHSIPEPSSLALFAMAAALACCRRYCSPGLRKGLNPTHSCTSRTSGSPISSNSA
jgi:Bacterial pre-peptidase C-terminal domain/PEP-CTERM motif